MKKPVQQPAGSEGDKALAKPGTAKQNPEKLKTDNPISEKDEVKEVEEELRLRMEKKKDKPE